MEFSYLGYSPPNAHAMAHQTFNTCYTIHVNILSMHILTKTYTCYSFMQYHKIWLTWANSQSGHSSWNSPQNRNQHVIHPWKQHNITQATRQSVDSPKPHQGFFHSVQIFWNRNQDHPGFNKSPPIKMTLRQRVKQVGEKPLPSGVCRNSPKLVPKRSPCRGEKLCFLPCRKSTV